MPPLSGSEILLHVIDKGNLLAFVKPEKIETSRLLCATGWLDLELDLTARAVVRINPGLSAPAFCQQRASFQPLHVCHVANAYRYRLALGHAAVLYPFAPDLSQVGCRVAAVGHA
jgi:hypothetical protein